MPTKRQSKGYTRVLSWTFCASDGALRPRPAPSAGHEGQWWSMYLRVRAARNVSDMFGFAGTGTADGGAGKIEQRWTKISRSAVQSFFETKNDIRN